MNFLGFERRIAMKNVNEKIFNALKGGFFVNQFQYSHYIDGINDGYILEENNKFSFVGNGTMTTVNRVNSHDFTFKASVKSSTGNLCYADYFFFKSDRLSVSPEYAYSLRIYSNGNFRIVRFYPKNIHEFELIKTGKDFTELHTFKVHYEQNDYLASEISVDIDGSNAPYTFIDRAYGFELRENGYFGVKTENYTVTATVADLEFSGAEEEIPDDAAAAQVLLPDYIVTESGDGVIHWVYSNDYYLYKGVSITDCKGKEIAFVDYPNNVFSVTDDYENNELYVTAISIDGKRAISQQVKLIDNANDYIVKEPKKLIIRPADDTHTSAGFMTEDGKEFLVKGFNYIELRYTDHSTFEPAIENVNSADYDPLQSETWLKTLASLGYNTVRCFLVAGNRLEGNRGLTGPRYSKEKLCYEYVYNLIDFLKRAQKFGIYVILNFTENEMIYSDYYREMSRGASGQNILFSKDGIAAKVDYLRTILQIISDKDSSLFNTLLGIEGQNEFAFYKTSQPWINTSGIYTYFDGTKYDMGDNESRHELAKHAMKTYYSELKAVLHEFDERLLLGEGSFTMAAVNKRSDDPLAYGVHPECSGDARVPVNMVDYLSAGLDFFDMHDYWCGEQYYPNEEKCIDMSLENMKYDTEECKALRRTKPVILGEFGNCSTTDMTEESMSKSVGLLKEAIKRGFAGGLFWTYQYIARRSDKTDGRISDYLLDNLKYFYFFDK